jgi:hypothetical protein
LVIKKKRNRCTNNQRRCGITQINQQWDRSGQKPKTRRARKACIPS